MKIKSFAIAAVLTLGSHSVQALDASAYKSLVAETISGISGGDVDVDQLIGLQMRLVAMGIEGARAFAVSSPADSTLMNFVADHAEAMQQMTLPEIEAAWHDGEALQEIGIDFESLDHFGPQISHMDAIIHPATAVIALREYKSSGDKSYLLQVKDELAEVIQHIDHVN